MTRPIVGYSEFIHLSIFVRHIYLKWTRNRCCVCYSKDTKKNTTGFGAAGKKGSVLMTSTTLTPSLEDYIETIFDLCRRQRYARIRDVVKEKQVNSSTVTSALKRLEAMSLVDYQKRGYILLTEKGEAEARKIVAKHALLSRFFSTVLMMSKRKADAEACAIEHHLSAEARDRMVSLFEYLNDAPEETSRQFLDGFAHYLKGAKGERRRQAAARSGGGEVSLDTLSPGQKGTVVRIGGTGAVRQRLLDMGLLPGTVVSVERTAPTGDPIWVDVGGDKIALRKKEAAAVATTLP